MDKDEILSTKEQFRMCPEECVGMRQIANARLHYEMTDVF
jgi:hypothetical protein